MSEDTASARRVIDVKEHAWTAELRRAPLRWSGDAPGNKMSRREVNPRLLDVGDERLARMNAGGVDTEVLSSTTPAPQPVPQPPSPQIAVPLAREANDVLADAVRGCPDRFVARATLPMSGPRAVAAERERAVSGLGHVGCCPPEAGVGTRQPAWQLRA